MLLYFWVCAQIILESLPISSSGHVQLLTDILQKYGFESSLSIDTWMIDYFLHGATIVILLFYFFKQWWKMIFKKPISVSLLFEKESWIAIMKAVLFAFVASVVPVLFWLSELLPTVPVFIGFAITGVVLSYLKNLNNDKEFDWNITNAFFLGVVQGYSLLPGVSRFATTYVTGRYLGYNRESSFAVSFLIQMPLILAGFGKGLLALQKHPDVWKELFSFKMIVVMLGATCISYIALYIVGKIIERGQLWRFSRYMIIPTVVSFFMY